MGSEKVPAEKSAAQQQETAQRAADKATAEARQRRSAGGGSAGVDAAAGRDGIAQEVADAHEARTTVPGASNVDARLDNRSGADRPPLEQWPAKPQQIDGPDVAHQVEHTRRVLAERQRGEETDGRGRKGMNSPGPHGLSDESLCHGGKPGQEQTLYGTESLTEAEVADGTPKADG